MNFDAVMYRLREALGAKDNKALALALGMKPNALYNRRASRSVPLEQLVSLARARRLSCDWLLFGLGSSDLSKKKQSRAAAAEFNAELFGEVYAALDTALRAEGLDVPIEGTPLGARDKAILHVMLAGGIYKEVLLLKPGAGRKASIAAAAETTARALAVSERRAAHATKQQRSQ